MLSSTFNSVMGVFQYYRGAAEDNPVGVLYNIIVSTQLVFLTAFAIDCVWNQVCRACGLND